MHSRALYSGAACCSIADVQTVPVLHLGCCSRRHLTALVLGADGDDERYRENFEVAESSEGDEHIAALVQALPQLCALKLFDYGTDLATDAG